MQDWAIGWFVIPGAVASLGAALWTYIATRDLNRIESRLRRDEEAFKLAQSPRVQASIDLWCALCDFERLLDRCIYPSFSSFDVASQEELAASPQSGRLDPESVQALRAAERTLRVARDKAELLLPAGAFETLEAAAAAYGAAYDVRWSKVMGWPSDNEATLQRHLTEARRLRTVALEEFRALIAAEPSAR